MNEVKITKQTPTNKNSSIIVCFRQPYTLDQQTPHSAEYYFMYKIILLDY